MKTAKYSTIKIISLFFLIKLLLTSCVINTVVTDIVVSTGNDISIEISFEDNDIQQGIVNGVLTFSIKNTLIPVQKLYLYKGSNEFSYGDARYIRELDPVNKLEYSLSIEDMKVDNNTFFHIIAMNQKGNLIKIGSKKAIDRYQSKWTVLYYLSADNNLDPYLMNDFNEIEGVNLDLKDIRVITLVDRAEDPFDDGFSDTRCYLMGYDKDGYNNKISSATVRLAVESLGISETGSTELNMSDYTTLSKFTTYGIENFPAERYMLLVASHGDGWRSSDMRSRGRLDTISQDVTSGGEVMEMGDFRIGLENALSAVEGVDKFDIIAFDACTMGMTEVAYELKGVSDYLIASAANIPAYGYPYTLIFNNVIEFPGELTPDDMSRVIVEQYGNSYRTNQFAETDYAHNYSYTLSAVDLSGFEILSPIINNLAVDLTDDDISTEFGSTIFYNYRSYVDLYDFCDNVSPVSPDFAADVKTFIEEKVIYKTQSSSYAGHGGLSIFLPYGLESGHFESEYTGENILFAKDTPNWQDLF